MASLILHLSLEQDASILSGFHSGVEEMDTFIHTRLASFLRAYKCRFYVLRSEQGTIVAMFVISAGQLFLDEDCKEDLRLKFPDIEEWPQLRDYWEAGVFPSIEIDYLAVQEEYRKQKIGEDILSIIESFKDDVFYNHPLFLSVNAFYTEEYSAVGFYNKCRFWASEFTSQHIDSVRMYRTLRYPKQL